MTWHFNSSLKNNAYQLKGKVTFLFHSEKAPCVNLLGTVQLLRPWRLSGHAALISISTLSFRWYLCFSTATSDPLLPLSQRHDVIERHVVWPSIEPEQPWSKGPDSVEQMSVSFLWKFKTHYNTQLVCFCGLGHLCAWFGNRSPDLRSRCWQYGG